MPHSTLPAFIQQALANDIIFACRMVDKCYFWKGYIEQFLTAHLTISHGTVVEDHCVSGNLIHLVKNTF